MTPAIAHGTARAARTAALAVLLAAIALAAAGCARRALGPPPPAKLLWAAFQDARKQAAKAGPGLFARASLQYSGPRRHSRVVLKLWGNLGYPLRLDMEAGIGASVAFVREDSRGWLAYFPRTGEAALDDDPRHGLRALGVDAPLSLADLAALATGTYAGLATSGYRSAEPSGDGGWTFGLPGAGPVSRLTLDASARPVAMAGNWAGSPWRLTLAGFDDQAAPGAPASKMTLERPPETTVVIRIKELERRPEPWPAKALALELPPGTRIVQPAAPTAEPGIGRP